MKPSLLKRGLLIAASSMLWSSSLVVQVRAAETVSAPATGTPVKLVLQITIDQLRGDLPRVFKERFGPGGFRYLMDKGVFYNNAHYMHADTETGPGHATLVTGAQPGQHGIIGGDWWDESTKRIVYSVEDNNYKVFPSTLTLRSARPRVEGLPRTLSRRRLAMSFSSRPKKLQKFSQFPAKIAVPLYLVAGPEKHSGSSTVNS